MARGGKAHRSPGKHAKVSAVHGKSKMHGKKGGAKVKEPKSHTKLSGGRVGGKKR